MSGGGAPPPPETFKMPNQEGAANNAFAAIGGLEAMPNYADQTYNAIAPNATAMISQPTGYNPAQTTQYGNAISALPAEYLPYARNILNEGFDVNGQAYGRAAHDLTEQVRASQGARGIQTSPYGAGLENEAMGDFNIDWQGKRLDHMSQAMGAALPAYGQAGSQMGYGQQVAQMGPRFQADLASQMGDLGNSTYTQPNMAASQWLNYSGAATANDSVTAQNYATQIQAYQAEQAADAAMWAAVGELGGVVTGAALGPGGFAR